MDTEIVVNCDRSWWTRFQHKVVILLALIVVAWQRRFSNLEERQNLGRYVWHAQNELSDFCNEIIEPQDSQTAKKLVTKIVTPLHEIHKAMCRCTPSNMAR